VVPFVVAAMPGLASGSVGLVQAQDGASLTLTKTLHVVDVTDAGVDYYISAHFLAGASTRPATKLALGVVVPIPRIPDDVAIVPSGILTGLDGATTAAVLPCPSEAAGCGARPNTIVAHGEGEGAPSSMGLDGGNVPAQAYRVVNNVADALAFMKGRGLLSDAWLERDLESLFEQGHHAIVLQLAEESNASFPLGLRRAATLRVTFKGTALPLPIPLFFHPGAERTELATGLIVVSDGKRGALQGVEVVPIDVKTVPSPRPFGSGSDDEPAPRPPDRTVIGPGFRAIDTAIRATLGQEGGRTFVIETAQFIRDSQVAVNLPLCFSGENPDEGGCQARAIIGPCSEDELDDRDDCPPRPPSSDAGARAMDGGKGVDGGSTNPDAGADGGVPDGGARMPSERTSRAIPRMFPRDRFVTRFTTLGSGVALFGTARVDLAGDASAVGPGYLNCPAQEKGCAAAPGPTRLAAVVFTLALLWAQRRKTRRPA
jgi:hypothetical protein